MPYECLLLRCLAAHVKSAFVDRLRLLLRGSGESGGVRILFSHYPHRIPEFRARALPMSAGRIGLDALCCGSLLAALWAFPPSFLAGCELAILQYVGLLVVILAALADALSFMQMAAGARKAWRARPSADRAEPPQGA